MPVFSMRYGKLRVKNLEGKIFTGVVETKSDMKLRNQIIKTETGEELTVKVRLDNRNQVTALVRIDKENLILFIFYRIKPGVIQVLNGRNSSDGRFNRWQSWFATDSTDGRNPLV